MLKAFCARVGNRGSLNVYLSLSCLHRGNRYSALPLAILTWTCCVQAVEQEPTAKAAAQPLEGRRSGAAFTVSGPVASFGPVASPGRRAARFPVAERCEPRRTSFAVLRLTWLCCSCSGAVQRFLQRHQCTALWESSAVLMGLQSRS